MGIYERGRGSFFLLALIIKEKGPLSRKERGHMCKKKSVLIRVKKGVRGTSYKVKVALWRYLKSGGGGGSGHFAPTPATSPIIQKSKMHMCIYFKFLDQRVMTFVVAVRLFLLFNFESERLRNLCGWPPLIHVTFPKPSGMTSHSILPIAILLILLQ